MAATHLHEPLPYRLHQRTLRTSRRPRSRGLLATLREWHQRMRERADLAALDERTLHDLGLNRLEVENEIAKPFWRL